MNEQDWAPVVFHKKPQPKPKKSPQKTIKPKPEEIKSKKVEKLVNSDEPLVTNKISLKLRQTIQRKRQEKHWTQKDLAREAQLPESTIKQYENGTAIPQDYVITKLTKVLGPLSCNFIHQ